jgi:cytochrome c biogenesis protein CcmG/thiol:disulfide interchange protein DsbE
MRKSIWAKLLTILVVAGMLGACAPASAIEVGQTAPDFTLADADGVKVSLADYKGQVIILNFFASWCPPCRSEIPDFIDLQKRYSGAGFTFIGVSLVSAGETKDFAAKMGMNYPTLVDDGKVSNTYGPVRSIPTTFVIDKTMTVVKMYIGARSKETFENDIIELLK